MRFVPSGLAGLAGQGDELLGAGGRSTATDAGAQPFVGGGAFVRRLLRRPCDLLTVASIGPARLSRRVREVTMLVDPVRRRGALPTAAPEMLLLPRSWLGLGAGLARGGCTRGVLSCEQSSFLSNYYNESYLSNHFS